MSINPPSPDGQGAFNGRRLRPVNNPRLTLRVLFGFMVVAICSDAVFLTLHWMGALLILSVVSMPTLALIIGALEVSYAQNRSADEPALTTTQRSTAPWMVGGAILGPAMAFLIFGAADWSWAALTLASFIVGLGAQHVLPRRRGE